MSKAEDLAEKAYPQEMDGYCENNAAMRVGFKIGYHQAEKDFELTWEDIRELYIIFAEIDVDIELCKTDIKAETIGYYQEVLKRFKDYKEMKEEQK